MLSLISVDSDKNPPILSSAGAEACELVVAEGAQGVRDAGGGDGNLPGVLAALLHMVPHLHHLRGPVRGPGRGRGRPLLDRKVYNISVKMIRVNKF